ncbi:MAG TPA: PQQ-binding-like beta-propeller repeat protein [Streptosporangiaceae bacterium]|nr:PQQ-binding-like beta-propeller repeat protein [Streptosporangiaceae bacterium]
MLGSRQRLIIGAVTTLVAFVAGAVLVDRFVLQAEWWQVDRSETAAAAPPLAALGPPPGPVVTSWQLATPVHHSGLPPYDQVAHAVVKGQLIVVSGHGLSVRDGRSGQPRWHYYRGGWALLGWAATEDRIVVYTEREGNRGDRLLLGFDVVSGRELWRQSGAIPAATDRTTLRWPAASGVVLTTDGDRTKLHGRSAATGRRLWTKGLPTGCALPEAAAYASDGADGPDPVTAVALGCAGHSRVFAVDPATGRVRLDASYGGADPPEVAVRGSALTAVVVFDGTALRVYRDGRQLLSRAGDDACATMCPLAVEDDRLILVYRPGDAKRSSVEAVDLRSGRTLWRRDAPDYAAVTVSGGRLYALRPSLAANLLPAGIDIIGLTGGEVTTVPTPLVLGSRRDIVRPWLGAGGGLLYVGVPEAAPRPFGAARLVALRGAASGPGPAELGGVAAADWPDACDLLHKRDLAGFGAGTLDYRPRREYARVGRVRLSRAVSCTYEAPGRGPGEEQSAAAPRVTVEWVADTPGAAAGLLAALRAAQGRARDVPGIGDEAYELGLPSGTIAVRVGRYILAVDAFQSPGMATRLARSAAAHLRAQ